MHYKLSPSAAKRWKTCPGSLHLPGPSFTESSEHADEGTNAHDLAAQGLQGADVYQLTDNEELAEAVSSYIDAINAARAQYKVIAEHTEVTKASNVIADMGGTSDHVMMYQDGDDMVLHIFDYKHGVGVNVTVADNEQVLCYMSIWRSHYGAENIDKFRATIVQPRSFLDQDIVRNWECDNARIDEFEKEVVETVVKTDLVPGDHCRWCPKCLHCPVLIQRAYEVAEADFSEIEDDTEKLVELYKIAPAIKALLNRVEPAIINRFRSGRPVPGFHIKQRLSNRRWKFAEKDLAAKFTELGIDKSIFVEEGLKSPAQVEKGLKKHDVKINDFVERTATGFKLVAEEGNSVDLFPEFEVIE